MATLRCFVTVQVPGVQLESAPDQGRPEDTEGKESSGCPRRVIGTAALHRVIGYVDHTTGSVRLDDARLSR